MRILVTNDDGINAVGIKALALALHNAGHDIFIVAPAENQSAVGHGLTLRRMLYADKVIIDELENVTAYAINGTPADCVRLAIGNLGFVPEVVISGVNQAPNLGTDAVYSGTVAAALEGAMIGYRAIAVSKNGFTADYMNDAAKYFTELLPVLLDSFINGNIMLNVNIPSTPYKEYRGIRVGRLALQSYELRYTEEKDAEGRIAYRVTSKKLTECADCDDTDEKYMREGYVVITPLTYDITDYTVFDSVKSELEREN